MNPTVLKGLLQSGRSKSVLRAITNTQCMRLPLDQIVDTLAKGMFAFDRQKGNLEAYFDDNQTTDDAALMITEF